MARGKSPIASTSWSRAPFQGGAPPEENDVPPPTVVVGAQQFEALMNQVANLTAMVQEFQDRAFPVANPPAVSRHSSRSRRRRAPREDSAHPSPHSRPSPEGRTSRLPRSADSPQKGKRPRQTSSSSSEDSTPVERAPKQTPDYDGRFRAIESEMARAREQRMRDQRDPDDLIVGDLRPPYTDRIMAEDIPRHFRVPQMEPYDGTSDPLDHLGSFKAHMMIQGASDAMYCLAFPATLKKSARMWYSSLRPGTIDSFSELEKLFVLHFRTCRKTPRNTDTLFLHHNEGESL